MLRPARTAAAQIRGDAFLARVFDNEEHFERQDFTLAEVSSSAAWVKVRRRVRMAPNKPPVRSDLLVSV